MNEPRHENILSRLGNPDPGLRGLRVLDHLAVPIEPVTPRLKRPRNELCSCGSGRKYKKCCLLQETLKARVRRNRAVVSLVKEAASAPGSS